ncbi:MAG: hypothetical protein FWC09_01180 [Lachnospiraceae bacterium]|nr:hypothetical protein [Lachnospiraceae bacterium]
MEFIFIIVLTVQLLIAVFVKYKTISGISLNKSKFLSKSAAFIYAMLFRNCLSKSNTYIKIDKYVGNLNPGENRNRIVEEYYIEKIRISYLFILIGNILALSVSFYLSQNNHLNNDLVIHKNTWEQGSYNLDLMAADEENNREITIVVEPISLDEDEVIRMAQEMIAALKTVILNQNKSLDRVEMPLNLVTELAGYPFKIKWESDKPYILRASGMINNQDSVLTAEDVVITAHLTYQDKWTEYRFSEDFFVRIQPYVEVTDDGWLKTVTENIMANQKSSAYNESFSLPSKINGADIIWRQKQSREGLYLWLIIMMAAILVFVSGDYDLGKKVAFRNRQIDHDYSELIRKLALYLGAGMTLRGAWKRIAWDYKKTQKTSKKSGSQGIKFQYSKKKFLYEEMLFSVHELENGISEREVYERFAKRVGLAKYRKLMGLLSNHLQKGNKNILQVLREEIELDFEDRKKKARTIGEEMNTKLLLPMMLMLLIVMIIIMIPAFQMFNV